MNSESCQQQCPGLPPELQPPVCSSALGKQGLDYSLYVHDISMQKLIYQFLLHPLSTVLSTRSSLPHVCAIWLPEAVQYYLQTLRYFFNVFFCRSLMKILNNTHSLRGTVTDSSSSWIATINPFAFYLQAAFSSPKHQSHGNLFSSVVFC